ncbi:uncharacterized protein BKA78DRAFT_113717 [Phyllosticta capitalensis]|uniref:uncharacterized protein n=1 Tax=Phyllosticta capitalensis TaxID=121624 RepID=UPI00312F6F64
MATPKNFEMPEEAFLAALRALSFGGATDRKVEVQHLRELSESMLSIPGDAGAEKYNISDRLTRGFTAFLDIMLALGGARFNKAETDPSKPVLSDALKQKLANMAVVLPGKDNVENTEEHLQAINACLLEMQSQTSRLYSHLVDIHPYLLALENAEEKRKVLEKALKKKQSKDRLKAFFSVPSKGSRSTKGSRSPKRA